jgi:hypothetical protein
MNIFNEKIDRRATCPVSYSLWSLPSAFLKIQMVQTCDAGRKYERQLFARPRGTCQRGWEQDSRSSSACTLPSYGQRR